MIPRNATTIFTAIRAAERVVAERRKQADLLLAPVMRALQQFIPWTRPEYWPRRVGWVPRGHYAKQHQPPPLRVHRWLETANGTKRIGLQLGRYYPGSDRHGSGDLEYELTVTLPVKLVERGRVGELTAYLRRQIRKEASNA